MASDTTIARTKYDDSVVNGAEKDTRKYFYRCFKASGLWPWKWLPRDYQPGVRDWKFRAVMNLTIAIECACQPGSNVTLDELRDFLVNKLKEKSAQPTMVSDCEKAKQWVRSKNGTIPQKRDRDSGLSITPAMKRLRSAYNGRRNVEAAKDDEEISNELYDHMRLEMREMSQFSELSDLSDVSDTFDLPAQREMSLSLGPDPASTPKMPKMKLWPTSLERPRPPKDHESESDLEPEEPSRLPSDDEAEEDDIRAAEACLQIAINRALRSNEEEIRRCEKSKACFSERMEEVRKDMPSINEQEVSQVLQQATKMRDEAQEELDQMEAMVASTAAIVEQFGEKCSDLLRATHKDHISKRDNAMEKSILAESALKEMESLTQTDSKKHQKALDDIANLEKFVQSFEEVINEHVNTRHRLLARRSLLGVIERLDMASIDKVEEANSWATSWATRLEEAIPRDQSDQESNSESLKRSIH